MNVVVYGATGNSGSEIVKELLARGHKVTGVARNVDKLKNIAGVTAKTDDLSQTVNYFDVAQRIRLVAAKRPRKLLETLAEELAAEILAVYPVRKVALEIKKFILPDTRHVSVRIER